MRYIFLVLLMLGVMVGLITWSSRPDLIEAQYQQVATTIEQHVAAKRTALWQAAKEQAWKEWSERAHLPSDCMSPATAIRSLQCRNQLQLHAEAFERAWMGKIASGWKPDGVD